MCAEKSQQQKLGHEIASDPLGKRTTQKKKRYQKEKRKKRRKKRKTQATNAMQTNMTSDARASDRDNTCRAERDGKPAGMAANLKEDTIIGKQGGSQAGGTG